MSDHVTSTSTNESEKVKLHQEQTTYSEYYNVEKGDTSMEDLVLIGGGVEHCKSDYFVHREHFICYAVEYVASGSCRIKIDGEEHTIGPGSAFCYGPDVACEIEAIGDEPLIKYFVNFNWADSEGEVDHGETFSRLPVVVKNLRWAGDTFLQIHECGSSNVPQLQLLNVYLINYLIGRLACYRKATDQQPVSHSYSVYRRCRSFIESRFLEIHSIAEVAEACNVSNSYISRLFKMYANSSPCSLLMRLKLNRARELLKDEELLVKQVSSMVGFTDPFYFSNRFKRHFGVSPQIYKMSLETGSFDAA